MSNMKFAVVYSEDARRIRLGWDEPDEQFRSRERAEMACLRRNRRLYAAYPNALSSYSVWAKGEDGDWLPIYEVEPLADERQ